MTAQTRLDCKIILWSTLKIQDWTAYKLDWSSLVCSPIVQSSQSTKISLHSSIIIWWFLLDFIIINILISSFFAISKISFCFPFLSCLILNLFSWPIFIFHSSTIYQERKSPFELVLFRYHHHENQVMIIRFS